MRVEGSQPRVSSAPRKSAMPFPDRGVRTLLVDELERRNVRPRRAKAGELERAPDGVHLTGPG